MFGLMLAGTQGAFTLVTRGSTRKGRGMGAEGDGGGGGRAYEGAEGGGGQVATSMGGCSWCPVLQTSQVAKTQQQQAQESRQGLQCH